MDGEKLSNSNERNQSNAEKVLGTMPDFEKRKLRSKDDIRTEICERLDTNEKIEKFLKARGYNIFDKYFSHIDDSIKIAIKGDDPDIVPDTPEGAKKHIRAVFAEEVQDILLKWLLKIGK